MSNPNDYTVGWLVYTYLEYAAAQSVLDDKHEPPEFVSSHHAEYAFGRIGAHNVVIATLCYGKARLGLQPAASVVTHMRHSFPNVRVCLVLGDDGGVPSKNDIRLGDIVLHPRLNYPISTFREEPDPVISTLPHHVSRRTDGVQTKISKISSILKRYFVRGKVNGVRVEALPDTGADLCFISGTLASSLGLSPIPATEKIVYLANKAPVISPGMVEVPWTFAGEREKHMLNCWILPNSIHNLVLGSQFLKATQTLTKFFHRVKSELITSPSRLRLQLLGGVNQRLWGYLDGNHTAAIPDTGSDIMLISRAYAKQLGLTINQNFEDRFEVEFADGTTSWTSGVVRNAKWSVGDKTVRCDFNVLDDLCVDVVLSSNYLFDMNVFTECEDYFFDTGSEEDLSQFCNIRLIGQHGETLNLLEEDYLKDMNSPNSFSPEKIQRELARRDQIRDEISTLPQDRRKAARRDEVKRQQRWEALREAHRTGQIWQSTTAESSNKNGDIHRTEAYQSLIQAETPINHTHGKHKPQITTIWRTWWRKRVVSLPSSSRG